MRFCLVAKRSWEGDPIWLCQAGEGLHQALSKTSELDRGLRETV
jgi:hypothetical protein